jgi:hypothetical protein
MPTSSVQPQRDSSQRARAAPEEITLRVWPLVQEPLVSLAALAAAAAASYLAGWSYGRAWVALAVAGLLVATLWRTWLPVTYEIGPGGVAQCVLGRRRRIPWPAIRGWQVRGTGVLLVPDVEVAPLSPLRDLYLPWQDRRDQIVASLEYHLQGRGN